MIEATHVANTYHSSRNKGGKYEDMHGFCASVTTGDIAKHDFVLTPGRYVGAEDAEGFEVTMRRLSEHPRDPFAPTQRLKVEILQNLKALSDAR